MSEDRIIRCAVVQIESHPALYAQGQMPLEEPFYDKDTSLLSLGRFGVPVDDAHWYCREAYIEWQTHRLGELLRRITDMSPAPDVIVFPEYAVPVQALSTLEEVVNSTGAVIFAGTHSVQATAEARKIYRDLGVEDQVKKATESGSQHVLPILTPSSHSIIGKVALSPFEKSSVSASGKKAGPKLDSRKVDLRDGVKLSYLPAICAEALQAPVTHGNYDLVVVLSYQPGPQWFSSFIDQQVTTGRPVLYANDAKFGGSGVHTVLDERGDTYIAKQARHLPPEEAFIVADINLSATTVQVSTAVPASAVSIVRLSSIVSSSASSGAVAKQIEQASQIVNAEAQHRQLQLAASGDGITPLQLLRVNELTALASRGIADTTTWKVIGKDCVVPTTPLRVLESNMAAECMQAVVSHVGRVSSEGAESLVKFMQACQSRIPAGRPQITATEASASSVFDRDDDTKAVLSFLDNDRLRLLQVTGLPSIGKSAVLEKALFGSAIPNRAVCEVTIGETSTSDFILSTILYGSPDFASEQVESITLNSLSIAVSRYRLIIFRNSHHLGGRSGFRNKEIEQAFGLIVDAAKACGTKIILEGRWSVPSDTLDAAQCQRLQVQGLPHKNSTLAVQFLENQLRRANVPIEDFDAESRQRLVQLLGGHPVALALAADRVFEDGMERTLSDVRECVSFWKAHIARLVEGLSLSETEQAVLGLVSQSNLPIGREVLQQTLDAALTNEFRSLIELSILERCGGETVSVAAVLRPLWQGAVEGAVATKFHEIASRWFEALGRSKKDLACLVEADRHARIVGMTVELPIDLLDGKIAHAKQLFESQQYAIARLEMDQILNVKRTPDLVRLSALIDARCNDFDSALRKAKEVFAADPDDTYFLSDLERAALSLGERHRVDEILEIARAEGVEDTAVAIIRGKRHLRLHEYQEAIDSFARAKEMSVRNAWPFFYLGRVYSKAGDNDEAIEALEDGQEFFYKQDCRSMLALGKIQGLLAQTYLLSGKDDEAEALIGLLRQRDKGNAEYARADAMLRLKKDGITQASEAFRRLSAAEVSGSGDRCSLHLYYALFLIRTDQREEANEQFMRAHNADQTNIFVLLKWAENLFELADSGAGEQGDSTDELDGPPRFAELCGQRLSEALALSPRNQKARDLQETLYSRFKIEVTLPEDL